MGVLDVQLHLPELLLVLFFSYLILAEDVLLLGIHR